MELCKGKQKKDVVGGKRGAVVSCLWEGYIALHFLLAPLRAPLWLGYSLHHMVELYCARLDGRHTNVAASVTSAWVAGSAHDDV